MSYVDMEPKGIIGPSPEDLAWLRDHEGSETRLSSFLRQPIVKGVAGVLGIVSIAELAAACTQPQPPAIMREATTPTPIPTETPKPTPTLTPEPTPTPEPKIERNPLPPYGVFSGDVFRVDENSGAKTPTGKIVIASIPPVEQDKPETIFFYYITNSRQLMPLQLPITKIEGNTILATRGSWTLQVTLIQPGIGRDVKPVLQGEIQGTIPGGKIEATQVGVCKETLEKATKSMKNKQLKLGISERAIDSVNISELEERGITFPDVCPISR